MYTIIIGTLLGILISLIICYKRRDWVTSLDSYVLSSFLGFIIGAFISIFIASFLINKKIIIKSNTVLIQSLQDNSGGLSGNFFLGCGQIDGKMKYMMYARKDSGFYLIQLDCDKVFIIYSDSTPRLIVSKKELDPNYSLNKFAALLDNEKHYIIKVPKGTIKNDFTLDAK